MSKYISHRSAVRLCALTGGLVAASGPAAAHVDYVTDQSKSTSVLEVLAGALSSPMDVLVVMLGVLAMGALLAGYLRFGSAVLDIQIARRTLQSYRPYLPWMLRLSVGLPLVGAGFGRYLFSPGVPTEGRLLQVGLGFFLLFGLATRVVAAVGLVTYLVALLTTGPALLLASEYVGGFLAIIILGPGQPSADMMLQRLVLTDGTVASRLDRALPRDVLSRVSIGVTAVPLVLRVFLGLNFVYLGVGQKLLQPGQALAVVATYDLTAVLPVSPELWVVGAGLTEAAIGLAFIIGVFTRATATVSFVMLTTTLFGLPGDPVLAHVTLFGLSSALMVTGAGRYSLDASVVPALQQRVDPRLRQTEATPDRAD